MYCTGGRRSEVKSTLQKKGEVNLRVLYVQEEGEVRSSVLYSVQDEGETNSLVLYTVQEEDK